jgi:hypothetical protein
MPFICSRPPKLNDADTVLYEIYMLRFAAKRLLRKQWEESQDAWVYLEDFLVHYRNLIEFLGKQNNIRDTDLHVTTIWAELNVSPPQDLAKIHADGAKLWAEYEQVEDKISRYLQHCTTKRTEAKHWFIDEMSEKIEPLLATLVPVLQSQSHNPELPSVGAVHFLGPHPASTAVYTPTAAVAVKPLGPAEPGK